MKKSLLLAVLLLFSLSGCLSSGHDIIFYLNNLKPLEGNHYEAWAIFGDEKVSIGKFLFENGEVLDLNMNPVRHFSVNRNLRKADQIAITIEPEGDADNIPSGITVMVGDFRRNSAILSFPMDLYYASGRYILATPTNGYPPESNEESGVWFLVPSEGEKGMEPGLVLPDAPSGWKYEGWVVYNGTAISMGRFTSVSGNDEFNGFSGSEPAPPFPGEDFLFNPPEGLEFPINLAVGSSTVMVSIEPDLHGTDPTGDEPFWLRPLSGRVPENATHHVVYEMEQDLSNFPVGRALVK